MERNVVLGKQGFVGRKYEQVAYQQGGVNPVLLGGLGACFLRKFCDFQHSGGLN